MAFPVEDGRRGGGGNDQFLLRSFLFEVVDSDTEKIDASFTLVIPPNAYSIKEPHRVNITKTFGNAFIDDYGPDNIQMVIKGISGTAHVFPTFKTDGTSQAGGIFGRGNIFDQSNPTIGYRHREAFYEFRDSIMRYKDNFRDSFDQKELRVYDLYDEQAYKCVLLEFLLERSSDRPFHYPFTIQLFVYAKLGTKDAFTPKKITIAKPVERTFNNLDKGNESLNERFKVFDNIQNIRNTLATAQRQTQQLRSQFNTWLTKARTVVTSPLIFTKQLLDIMATAGGLVFDAYSQGKLALEAYTSATETIDNQVREILGLYGFSISEGAQQSREEVIEENAGLDFSDVNNPVPAATANTYSYDGVVTYTVKGGDTLQLIAQNELGDGDLWPYIASVNEDIASNQDLVVGDEIYLPVTTEGTGSTSGFILTEDALRDPYGADIKLDSDGNMVVLESNDLGLVSGVANVLQAIDLRLATQIGSMIKQTAYGLISPGLAGTEQTLSYIRMGLKDALIKDPRIQQVPRVDVEIDGDTVTAKAELVLVGREESLPVAVVIS